MPEPAKVLRVSKGKHCKAGSDEIAALPCMQILIQPYPYYGDPKCAKLAVQLPLLVDADHAVCTSCGTERELHSGRDRFVCIYKSNNAELLAEKVSQQNKSFSENALRPNKAMPYL